MWEAQQEAHTFHSCPEFHKNNKCKFRTKKVRNDESAIVRRVGEQKNGEIDYMWMGELGIIESGRQEFGKPETM